MRKKGGITLPLLMLSFGICMSVLYSCEQTCYDGELNQDELAIDCGGACVPCDSTVVLPPEPTCFDGIMNQDETGVDCGGICLPCPGDTTNQNSQLCTGDGSSSIFPLSNGNYWRYAVIGGSAFTLTVTGVETLIGNEYYRIETGGSLGPAVDFFREDGTGNVYHLQADVSGTPVGSEFLYFGGVSGWPVVATGVDSVAVIDMDTTIAQVGCTYTGAELIYEYNASSLQLSRIMKQGLGIIQYNFVSIPAVAYLDSVALN